MIIDYNKNTHNSKQFNVKFFQTPPPPKKILDTQLHTHTDNIFYVIINIIILF